MLKEMIPEGNLNLKKKLKNIINGKHQGNIKDVFFGIHCTAGFISYVEVTFLTMIM